MPQFANTIGQQQDAHEFLTAMHDDLPPALITLFRWRLGHTLVCETCGDSREASVDERELGLALPCRSGPFGLEGLVQGYFDSENVEVTCESCHGTRAIKEMGIKEFPRVGILVLNRFGQSMSGEFVKRREAVCIPEVLKFGGGEKLDEATWSNTAVTRLKNTDDEKQPTDATDSAGTLAQKSDGDAEEQDQIAWAMSESVKLGSQDSDIDLAIKASLECNNREESDFNAAIRQSLDEAEKQGLDLSLTCRLD